MSNNRQIQREKVATYASVLFDSAYEAGGKDLVLEIRNQIEDVLRVVRTNMTLSDVLRGTDYNAEERVLIARASFAGFNPMLVDTLAIMAELRDFALLQRVWNSYCDVIREKLNTTVVDVTTAVELTDPLRELVVKKARAEYESDVVLREYVDKSIIGGIIMVANGKRNDASILSQLEEARYTLKQTINGGEASD